MHQISFIIPAYNAASTLERAVVSIEKLNLDAEVIIVENGCTDNTDQVAAELGRRYSNLVVLSSDKGVSKARNAGMAAADGIWAVFVDADDYLEPDAGHQLRQAMEDETADLWLFGHIAGNIRKPVADSGVEICTDIEAFRVKILRDPTRYMEVWAKLFRLQVIREHGLCFDEEMSYSEDSDFLLRYTRFCHKAVFSTACIYHYMIDTPSAMRGSGHAMVDRYIFAMTRTREKIAGESPAIQEAFNTYILIHLNISMVRGPFASTDISFREQIKQMRKALNADIYREALDAITLKECRRVKMLPEFFIKSHNDYAAALLFRIRARQNASREKRS